jgi:hypothetical protein
MGVDKCGEAVFGYDKFNRRKHRSRQILQDYSNGARPVNTDRRTTPILTFIAFWISGSYVAKHIELANAEKMLWIPSEAPSQVQEMADTGEYSHACSIHGQCPGTMAKLNSLFN